MDFRDVVHAVVVGQNRGNDGEACAIAGIDDEQCETDDRRPEAAEHHASGDAENEQQDVDAVRKAVGPPCEEKAPAAVHQSAKRDYRCDDAFGVAYVGCFHHLLGERYQAQSGRDVQKHEEPGPEEERILRELDILELQRWDAVSEALNLDFGLFEQECRDSHGKRVERGERIEGAGDAEAAAVDLEIVEEAEKAQREQRFGSAETETFVDYGRERGAEPEGDYRQRRRDGLVLREPQHHGLYRRDVDDAGAEADQKAVSEIDERQRLRAYAETGHAQSRKKERRADDCRQPYVLLDDFAEEGRSHAKEENPERESELHLFLEGFCVVSVEKSRDFGREVGERVYLPDGNREQKRRKDGSGKTFHERNYTTFRAGYAIIFGK